MKADKEENKSSGCIKVAVDDYIECSGVHGVRYLGEKKRPLCERMCWAATLMLSMSFSFYMILQAWQQWEESPTLWTFDEPMHVLDIPFPTVIICPPCHFDQDVFSMSKNFSSLSPEEKERLLIIQLLCLYDFGIEQNDFLWTLNKSTVIKMLELPREIDLDDCTSHPQSEFCHPKRIHFTMFGVCHTFNMLPASQIYKPSTVQYSESVGEDTHHIWNLETGFVKHASFNEPPSRRKDALLLMIPTETQLKHKFKDVPKVMVKLTNPAEVSAWSGWIQLNIETWSYIAFEVNIVKASEGLRNYSPEKRKCYFPSERQLAYFTTYTKHNCEIECLTNMTLSVCKCVEYYMPRIVGTPVCGKTSWKNCSTFMPQKLDNLMLKDKMEGVQSEGTCNCLKSCVSLDFKMILTKELTPEQTHPVYLMQLHPKTIEFTVRRRIEKYTSLDFIAQSGGLLGLYCGISILSFVELFYHCTLRLWNGMK